MRVPEASQPAAVPDVGAVRVALLVGVSVVLAMVGDPVEHRPLDRQRAEHGEHALEPRISLKRAVRQQTVEADRDPERAEQVHDREDREVGRVDGAVPQQHDRREHAEERDDDAKQVRGAFTTSHGSEALIDHRTFLANLDTDEPAKFVRNVHKRPTSAREVGCAGGRARQARLPTREGASTPQ